MARKLSPEIRVRVYPQKAISSLAVTPIVIADEFASLMERDAGDGGNIRGDAQLKPDAWAARSGLILPDNVRVVCFASGSVKEGSQAATEGASNAVAGICLRGQEYPLNCVMEKLSTGQTFRASGDPKYEEMVWKAVQDVKDAAGRSRWDTILPDDGPRSTQIMHTHMPQDTLLIARTKENLYADACFHLRLKNLQTVANRSSPAKLRFVWGGGAYSLAFREEAKPTLERRARPRAAQTDLPGSTGSTGGSTWEIWRELSELETTTFTEKMDIRVEQLGGRLTMEINGTQFNFIDTLPVYGAEQRNLTQTAEATGISWPEGPLTLYLWNVSATLGVSLIRYSEPPLHGPGAAGQPWVVKVPEKPAEAMVSRIRKRAGMDVLPTDGPRPRVQGWRPAGTKVTTALKAVGDKVIYDMILDADKQGRYTPFITGINGYMRGDFESEGIKPLDLTPAVVDWSYSGSEPGIATSAELQLTVQRDVMDALPLPDDVPSGKNWRYYVDTNGYNPIDFAVRWMLEDGSLSPWRGLFKGFCWDVNKDTPEYGESAMSISARDKTVRFKEPAGILDEKYPPLGNLLPQDMPVYAADCIKQILRILLGEDEANLMNGNGDARRFLAKGHPPLLSRGKDVVGFYEVAGKPPATGKMLFRPPYLRDASSWIGDFAKDDGFGDDLVVFYYGYPDAASASSVVENWPVPIYGLMDEMLKSRSSWEISDTVYADLPGDQILGSVSVQARPDKDYNSVLIVNSPSSFDKESYPGPGLMVAHARLDQSDPAAMEKSWERVAVRENSCDWQTEEGVQRMANQYIDLNRGSDSLHVEFELVKGEARMQWGDVFKTRFAKVRGGLENPEGLESDQSLNLNGKWFRALRVRHSGSQESRDFKTSVQAYSLSEDERATLGLT